MKLSDLSVGQKAIIKKIQGKEMLQRRLLDMGLTKNTSITVCKIAPFGSPIEVMVRDYALIIRKEVANLIEVEL